MLVVVSRTDGSIHPTHRTRTFVSKAMMMSCSGGVSNSHEPDDGMAPIVTAIEANDDANAVCMSRDSTRRTQTRKLSVNKDDDCVERRDIIVSGIINARFDQSRSNHMSTSLSLRPKDS